MSPVNLIHSLPKVTLVDDRVSLILDYCRNKNVLHLGCVESGATVESFKKGALLHSRILKVANKAIGVDIDRDGLEFLSSQGVKDLIYCDIQKLEELNIDIPIDIVVAGEILEHLSNPGLFLKGIYQFLNTRNNDTLFIMSVPNAFSLIHFMSVFLNKKELVMPDHTFYLSYITIKALLEKYNLRVINFYTYSSVNNSSSRIKRFIKKIINNTILKFAPYSAEGLIAVARKNDSLCHSK